MISMIHELNQRSRDVFRHIVDAYVTSGEPVGSRTVARRLARPLSAATIRNVMADLEEAGLLYAPHTSAGRLPTDAGLRLYVDGLLEVGNLTQAEKSDIEARCAGSGRSVEAVLADASDALSGLSRHAGLVIAPTSDAPFKHVEFVPLSPGRALVVVVHEGGLVENRIIDLPLGMSAARLIEAGNYLTARLAGRNLGEARQLIASELETQRSQLDALSQKVVEAGLAIWSGSANDDGGVLILKGQAHLLGDVTNLVELERIRSLFEAVETKKNLLRLIDRTAESDGVQIFIGAETELFGLSGCSLVVAPYRGDADEGGRSTVLGAVGVVGPMYMNYARIIPMVDYTARVVGRLLSHSQVKDEHER
jgi:heat-inducible transcriptional repressor